MFMPEIDEWGQTLDSAILNPRCLLLKTKFDRILRANDVTARIAESKA